MNWAVSSTYIEKKVWRIKQIDGRAVLYIIYKLYFIE